MAPAARSLSWGRARRVRWVTVACALAAAGVAATLLAPGTTRGGATSASRTLYAYVTYYGWFDNTPPGCATAYSGCAGGAGTFAHPITLATDRAELPVGTIVYYPTVEKYFVMGDDCQECDADWTGHGPDGGPGLAHVDLWTGGRGGRGFPSLTCEDALTQSTGTGAPLRTPLVVDPPSGLPVSTEPLFAPRTGHCYGGARSAVSYGRYRNAANGRCLIDQGSGTVPGRLAATATCTAAADEDLGFEGAFLGDRRLCLQTDGSRPGSPLVFATCTGSPSQQWELGTDGSIAWVQQLECVADVGGRVELSACTRAADERWGFEQEPPPA